jgi:hypothetical protein
MSGSAKRKQNQKSRSASGVNVMIKPPMHDSTVKLRKTFRFINGTSAGAVEFPITQTQISDILSVGNTAIVGWRLAAAIRVRKVRIWGMPTAGSVPTSPSSVSVEFNNLGAGNFGSPTARFADTTSSNAYPAYVEAVPPKGSLAASWFPSGATGQFCILNFSANLNTIIDIDLEMTLNNGEAAVATRALTVSTPGKIGVITITDGTVALSAADYFQMG